MTEPSFWISTFILLIFPFVSIFCLFTGHRTKCIWVEIEKKEKRFVGQRVVYDDGIKAYKTKCLRGFN